ncbi:MAG: carbohydrate ABC transporter permease [Devosia sp.]|jgi:multiple sugar transport system permease protein
MSSDTASTVPTRIEDYPVSRHARRGGLQAVQRRIGLMMLAPAAIAFALVILYPFGQALALSLFEDTLQSITPTFIGLRNFAQVLTDPEVWGSFGTTVIYVGCSTLGTLVLGLGWALLLNQKFRGRGVIRALTLMPWVVPSTVSAFIWAWIFNSRFGLINGLLLELHLIQVPQAWLSTPEGAMVAVILTRVWRSIPLFMAFFLAGLQNVDTEQLDAARVDGAGNFAILRDHVLPHLRPVLIVVVVLGVIGGLQDFDTIYALTGGGPVRATAVLSVEVYRKAFEQWDVGMASAIGVLWVATLLPPAFFYLRLLVRR